MTSLQNLSVSRQNCPVLSDISLTIASGEMVGLIGPNGAGKTTLMRAMLGLIAHQGQSSLAQMPPRVRGRAVAWMPQTREIAWPVSVEMLVALGRTPHLATGQRPSTTDQMAVDRALARMDLTALRQRTATQLSGGEQARVLIARALAQETPLLMADEPIAGLDPAHQLATMQCFADLAKGGHSVLVSLHDLGLAARYCTRLLVLAQGRIVADGPPQSVLTPQLLRDAFGITAWFKQTPQGPVFQPLEVTR